MLFKVLLLLLEREPIDLTVSIEELYLEEHVGVLVHPVLERDEDELALLEVLGEDCT